MWRIMVNKNEGWLEVQLLLGYGLYLSIYWTSNQFEGFLNGTEIYTILECYLFAVYDMHKRLFVDKMYL